jgi:putative membrane protein
VTVDPPRLLQYRVQLPLEKPLTESEATAAHGSKSLLALRGAVGGTLMGLANLVPGISGGTMLLAAGVYPGFIGAIAEATTLRFKPRSLLLLGTIVATAALAILLLAGSVRMLVVEHRWMMYSLFIGLTLGGVPLVYRMARPVSPSVVVAAAAAFALMVAMAIGGTGAGTHGSRNPLLVFLAGVAGSSAMILPGVSGGYLLLLLGQYESILGTVDQLKVGLLGDGAGTAPDLALILDAMHVVIPLGLGVVAGVVGVSNLLRWLLRRYEKATLGALLGLLFGAVVGLWPFQQARAPQVGDVIKGQVVSVENASEIEPEDWPVRFFDPTPRESATSVGLVALGLAATLVIGRLGGDESEAG